MNGPCGGGAASERLSETQPWTSASRCPLPARCPRRGSAAPQLCPSAATPRQRMARAALGPHQGCERAQQPPQLGTTTAFTGHCMWRRALQETETMRSAAQGTIESQWQQQRRLPMPLHQTAARASQNGHQGRGCARSRLRQWRHSSGRRCRSLFGSPWRGPQASCARACRCAWTPGWRPR